MLEKLIFDRFRPRGYDFISETLWFDHFFKNDFQRWATVGSSTWRNFGSKNQLFQNFARMSLGVQNHRGTDSEFEILSFCHNLGPGLGVLGSAGSGQIPVHNLIFVWKWHVLSQNLPCEETSGVWSMCVTDVLVGGGARGARSNPSAAGARVRVMSLWRCCWCQG